MDHHNGRPFVTPIKTESLIDSLEIDEEKNKQHFRKQISNH